MNMKKRILALFIIAAMFVHSSAIYAFANDLNNDHIATSHVNGNTSLTSSAVLSIINATGRFSVPKEYDQPESSIKATNGWKTISTETYTASVGGAIFAVGVGILASKVKGGFPKQAATALTSYFAGVWTNGKFPSGYGLKLKVTVSVRSINPSLGTYEQKNVNQVYYGKNGKYSKKAYSWTTTRTMYSSIDEQTE